MMLSREQHVGLIACSDGCPVEGVPFVRSIVDALSAFGLTAIPASTLYCKDGSPFSGTPRERAVELMKLYADDKIAAIFDISGGDSANQILSYLDYEMIAKHPKPFFGISDLSVLLNAVAFRSGIPAFHYQIANIRGPVASIQKQLFASLFFSENADLNRFVTFPVVWLRGSKMSGQVAGGNIRCFLKLAGTPYMPDPTGKILFLESWGGGINRIYSFMSQLDQIGYFERCNGVLLGTFTELEKLDSTLAIEDLLLDLTSSYDIPIAKTKSLGHGSDAHCLHIGMYLQFEK